MNLYKPEITELLHWVEHTYGKPLHTTTDFEEFSLALKRKGLGEISSSTLKRLWGYVADKHQPRMTTLDLLSQYVGHHHFQAFCQWLKKSTAYNSSFFSAQQLNATQLRTGQEVEIGWAPNRYLRLRYEGDSQFQVVEARESKLQAGDRFETACFLLGQPLSLGYVLRQGQRTPPFIAGRNGGLTLLNCL